MSRTNHQSVTYVPVLSVTYVPGLGVTYVPGLYKRRPPQGRIAARTDKIACSVAKRTLAARPVAFYGTIRIQVETMTGNEIASLENEIEDYNRGQEEKSLAKFKKGPVPKLKWVMELLLECLLGCIAAVKSGKAPDGQLVDYMSDELTRILATRTFLSYGGLSLDENATIEAGEVTDFAGWAD